MVYSLILRPFLILRQVSSPHRVRCQDASLPGTKEPSSLKTHTLGFAQKRAWGMAINIHTQVSLRLFWFGFGFKHSFSLFPGDYWSPAFSESKNSTPALLSDSTSSQIITFWKSNCNHLLSWQLSESFNNILMPTIYTTRSKKLPYSERKQFSCLLQQYLYLSEKFSMLRFPKFDTFHVGISCKALYVM